MRHSTVRLALAIALGIALSLTPPPIGRAGTPIAADDGRPEKHVRLEGRLAALADQDRTGPGAEGRSVVPITVEVFAHGGSEVALRALSAVGATDVVAIGDMVVATVRTATLSALGSDERLDWVRPASRPFTEAVTGQGVAFIDADDWHTEGITGADVKVAIIDLGFFGYTTRQAQGDLPASLTPVNYCGGSSIATNTDHGTAVAEIVHEAAPAAQLYLVCIETLGDLALAVDGAIAAGVRVINHSVGWFNTGSGDGSGALAPIVQAARDAGIVFVNSAGNYRENHWGGSFTDLDADGFHDFAPGDETNTFTLAPGYTISVLLKWNDWPTSGNDYDLYLDRDDGGGGLIQVAASEGPQSGTQPPTEELSYTNLTGSSQTLHVSVYKFAAVAEPEMDLFILDDDQPGFSLQFTEEARSLNDGATSPAVTAVGAALYLNGVIENFSARGPTIDGRIKPDLTGPDGVSSATSGSFFGTSASAPHVAGAAALILDAAPCLSAEAVHDLLVDLTEDRGAAGADNDYGAGLLRLGSSSAVAADAGCVLRYAGSDRYATAAVISQTDFAGGANTVFITTGQNFPDALAGTAVAGMLGAPILLVQTDAIPGATAGELARLGPDTIVILGGTAAVSSTVATLLEEYGTVFRLSGANRYATAAAISQYGFPGGAPVAVVVTGESFADALPAGPGAIALGGPVLLTAGTSLPSQTAAELARLGLTEILVIGGPNAVSDDVVASLSTIAPTTRISGGDRYATAVAMSTRAFGPGVPRVYVAVGTNFPDALAGGSAAGINGSPMLLVQTNSVPTVVADEILRLAPDDIVVLGGIAVIADTVEQALEDLLG